MQYNLMRLVYRQLAGKTVKTDDHTGIICGYQPEKRMLIMSLISGNCSFLIPDSEDEIVTNQGNENGYRYVDVCSVKKIY